MTPPQPTQANDPRTDPFRWSRADTATAFAHFSDPDHPSQRQYASQHGIPRATLGYWLRQQAPDDLDADLVAFLRCPAGERLLRRIVLAALLVLQQQGSCGLRPIGQFLRLARLDPFVATSYGALHGLAAAVQTDLGLFGEEEHPRLAERMTPRTVTLAADENFHGQHPCLVAIEPVSNFLLAECYREHRDGDTWTEAIRHGLRGLPVEVVLLTSDEARGLLRCARDGLEVPHSPDLFHRQRDLLKPVLLPLARSIRQAEKELEKATGHLDSLDGELPADGSVQMSVKEIGQIAQAIRHEEAAQSRLEEAQRHKEELLEQVRGLGDDYHPFDRHTGRPLTAEQLARRLEQRHKGVERVVEQADLSECASAAVAKSRSCLGALVAVVAWFWSLSRRRVEELELSEEAERLVYESLLPGLYWEAAARRGRAAEERKRLKEMAERLQQEAWQGRGALASLPEERREEVRRVAQECAGLFSRSSSCVEGRNGRLSLHHHGQGRLREGKLKALTVVHNYVIRRADGTTAAERFFGVKHRDVFAWLLERLPELPRSAAKRPKTAGHAAPEEG